MKIPLFLIFLSLANVQAREVLTHAIQGRLNYGMGNVKPAEVGDLRQDAINESLTLNNYKNYNSGVYPVPRTSINGNSYARNSGIGFEYRFQDAFRILLDHRQIENSKVNVESAFYPTTPIPVSKDSIRWSEKSYKAGIAQYFAIGDFISVGPMLRYYQVEQTFGDIQSYFFQYTNSSGTQNYAKSGVQDAVFKYKGLVPGGGIEFHVFDFLTVAATYEVLKLNGTITGSERTGNVYTPTNLVAYTIGTESIQRTSAMKIDGYNRSFSVILKPLSIFHIQIGYVNEHYKRTYGNYSYVTTKSIDVLESAIETAFYKNMKSKFEYNYPYIQFAVNFGF